MKPLLKKSFESEMACAWQFFYGSQLRDAFARAERAHVLGQRHVMAHGCSHWRMLRIGLVRRWSWEVSGQLVRIIPGFLGAAVGIVPSGNTGGANVGMFRRMSISADLARVLDA